MEAVQKKRIVEIQDQSLSYKLAMLKPNNYEKAIALLNRISQNEDIEKLKKEEIAQNWAELKLFKMG